MTANQRRPGFRLPWSPESDEGANEESVATVDSDGSPQPESPAPESAEAGAADGAEAGAPSEGAAVEGAAVEGAAAEAATAAADAAPDVAPGSAEPGGEEFMRDLVAAMRGVADEARNAGVSELRARADEEVRRLEADAEQRQEDLRQRTEADVAEVAEWARAESERIKTEADQRVVSRRAQLDQQLAADSSRTDNETKAVRDRVAEYERELDAYHAQLSDIADPAAFAAAAKRMPQPPALTGAAPAPAPEPAPPVAAEAPTETEADDPPADEAAPQASEPEPAEPQRAEDPAPSAPASPPPADEALAARLAALDATASGNGASAAPTATGEPVTTEVIVKGLGSFGAITGFRQSLSSVNGVEGVALSLGQTGEFVFRATHAAGFDLRAAIVALEGDGAKVEDRPEGGLRVTLERAR
jgi:hypothetical protein